MGKVDLDETSRRYSAVLAPITTIGSWCLFNALSCSLAVVLTTSVLVSPLLPAPHSSFADPEPCTGHGIGIHNPSVIKRPSDSKWFRSSASDNISIASAPNVTGPWIYQGAVLPNGTTIHVTNRQDIWASATKG